VRIFFAVPRSAWVDLNLRRSLEAMGHDLVRFTFPGWPDDADPRWRERGKPRNNEQLLRAFESALQEGPIDLFYGYFYSSVVYPETVDAIRRHGIPTVNFSCNNEHQFDLLEEIAPRFDLCVVPEQAAVEKFRAVGARPVRIQLAANPDVYRPYPEPRVFDVTFVGQRYADRAEFMCHLYRNGIRVRAWGAGWQTRKRPRLATFRAALALVEDERQDGVVRLLRRRPADMFEPAGPDAVDPGIEREVAAFGGPRLLQRDLIRTFSRSRISLGFATAGNSHRGPRRLTHLRLREFEAPMSGALYLTERQPELEEYFRIGEEVLCYEDRDDLLDQARHYLAHPEQAERVRRAGRQRALRDHTWQHRFRELFAALGLKG
jgi:spore maturation protein CgeB